MTGPIYIGFILLTSLGMAPLAFSKDTQIPYVSVTGSAITEVQPDRMLWNVRIQSKSPSLEGVAKSHTKSMEQILQFLKMKRHKVEQESMQTSAMSFRENWTYKKHTNVKDGYVASTNITFLTTDMNVYKDIWMGLSKWKEVSINGVQYQNSKQLELQKETRIKALLAAKEKAEVLAHTAGVQLGKPLMIEDNSYGHDVVHKTNLRRKESMALDASLNSSGAIAPGKISIQMRVKVRFELVPSS
jgi:uncharacterized protein YggE